MRNAETLSPAMPADVDKRVAEILELAQQRNWKIATAESCTGGLLASLLTDVEGKARCFERGFVCYSNSAKFEQLDVPIDTLDSCGAVSAETAVCLATGSLARSSADLAVAITGFAGEAGPSDEPGLVFIATAVVGRIPACCEFHFGNVGRGNVRIEALRAALSMLANELSNAGTEAAPTG